MFHIVLHPCRYFSNSPWEPHAVASINGRDGQCERRLLWLHAKEFLTILEPLLKSPPATPAGPTATDRCRSAAQHLAENVMGPSVQILLLTKLPSADPSMKLCYDKSGKIAESFLQVGEDSFLHWNFLLETVLAFLALEWGKQVLRLPYPAGGERGGWDRGSSRGAAEEKEMGEVCAFQVIKHLVEEIAQR